MSTEDILRLKSLIKHALKERRSKEDIISTFRDAGIINKKGDLKAPYKNIYIPVKE